MPTSVSELDRTHLMTAQTLGAQRATIPARWGLSTLSGRLTELSGLGTSSALTLAFELVLEAQIEDEPVAWITTTASSFFAPDVDAMGVDLDALAVVRLPPQRKGRTSNGLARAADKLIRSGAFGLVIIDLLGQARLSTPLLSRLVGLLQKHDTALLCLTRKSSSDASLDSLVSLRAEAKRRSLGRGLFRCEARALKDKRRGPGWRQGFSCEGPAGLTDVVQLSAEKAPKRPTNVIEIGRS